MARTRTTATATTATATTTTAGGRRGGEGRTLDAVYDSTFLLSSDAEFSRAAAASSVPATSVASAENMFSELQHYPRAMYRPPAHVQTAAATAAPLQARQGEIRTHTHTERDAQRESEREERERREEKKGGDQSKKRKRWRGRGERGDREKRSEGEEIEMRRERRERQRQIDR